MKKIIFGSLAFTLLTTSSFAQYSQAIKRVREVNNQNNVRQGVNPPAAPARPAAPTTASAKSTAPTAQQKISKVQADLAGIKPGTAVTAAQKQQLTTDIIACARGGKPSASVVTTFVNSLTLALTDKPLDAAEQERLAKDIDSILNSKGMGSTLFDSLLDDTQAILQVGTVKRNVAQDVTKQLRAVGNEVRLGGS